MANRQFEFGIGFDNRLLQPFQLHLQTDLRALRSTFSEYVDGILRAQLRCPVSFENPLTLDFNGSSNAYQRWRGGMGARTGLDEKVSKARIAASPSNVYYRSLKDDILSGRLRPGRSEEHTSELQSLMRISYAVFCLKQQWKI